jgi:hypothetical protein
MAEHPRKELAPGLTYRQLDYWTRRGLLHPDGPAPGSGHRRVWSEAEMAIARRVGELRLEGFELEAAFRRARAETNVAGAYLLTMAVATLPPTTPCGLGWPG